MENTIYQLEHWWKHTWWMVHLLLCIWWGRVGYGTTASNATKVQVADRRLLDSLELSRFLEEGCSEFEDPEGQARVLGTTHEVSYCGSVDVERPVSGWYTCGCLVPATAPVQTSVHTCSKITMYPKIC